MLRAGDACMIPFSLFWGGFAIFWEATVIAAGAPLFFLLWGIPFVLVGLYMIVGRFFVDARIRAKTLYGLTDRRVVIISGLFSITTRSLPLRTLHEISVQERRDGSGTVLFGHAQRLAAMFAGMPWPGTGSYQTPAFEHIPHTRRVHDQVLEAQRAAA